MASDPLFLKDNIINADDPLLLSATPATSDPVDNWSSPSSPRLGCYVALHHPYDAPPYVTFYHSPLAEAVADALWVPPGYKVGRIEAEHPFYLWATTLAWDSYRRLAEDEDEEEPDIIAVRRARVWWDEHDQTFVLIADPEILEDAASLTDVITCFGLAHAPYQTCVEPWAVEAVLAREGLSKAEADVVFDAASGRVVVQRFEAGLASPADPRPRLGALHEFDFSQPVPDWYAEKARQIPMWLDEYCF